MLGSSRLVILLLIVVTFTAFLRLINAKKVLSRQKRLIWPPGTAKIQMITGIGIPIDLREETGIVSVVIKSNHLTPNNITELHNGYPIIEARRQKRTASRWDVYDLLAQLSNLKNLGGRSCVLKSICEAAEHPIDKTNGLFDEIFHTIFTPTSTFEKPREYSDNEYFAAHKLGKKNIGACQKIFADCRSSYMNMFTEFTNIF